MDTNILLSEVSVSGVKNVGLGIFFKGFDPFKFLICEAIGIDDLPASTVSDAMPHRPL